MAPDDRLMVVIAYLPILLMLREHGDHSTVVSLKVAFRYLIKRDLIS